MYMICYNFVDVGLFLLIIRKSSGVGVRVVWGGILPFADIREKRRGGGSFRYINFSFS